MASNSAKRELIESVQLDSQCTVDKENGVIRNVRVLGSRSKNCHDVPGVTEGTEYTRQAMNAVLPLYEDNTVNVDHNRKDPDAERPLSDVFGVIRENKVIDDPDGPAVRANLHYNRAHPLAAMVVEDVERKLGRCGLSHHAFTAKARVHEGRYIVESIGEVRSIDLVTRPATNKNLFESIENKTMKFTFRQVLESRRAKYPKTVKRLLEMDDAVPADMPATDAPVDSATAIDEAFVGAMKALIDGYASGSVSDAEMIAKLKQLVKAHKGINGGGKDEEIESEEKPEEKKEEEKKMESLKLKRENEALKCLLESGISRPSPILLKALQSLETDADRKELLKAHTETSGVRSIVPGHGLPARTVESTETLPSVKDFAASIRD